MADQNDKRSRTSPRTTAFLQSVEAILKIKADGGSLDDAAEAVKSLVGTSVAPPVYMGTNYVAVLNGGLRISFKSSARPSVGSHGKQFQKAMGPWKLSSDPAYQACLAGDDTEAPIVFEINEA